MCKVRIVNKPNNYITYDSTEVEVDIPSEMVPVFKQVFNELNSKRTNACMPSISIVEL